MIFAHIRCCSYAGYGTIVKNKKVNLNLDKEKNNGGDIAVAAASGGVLEVVVADPEFKSRVTLVQFADGASLNGVTATVVKDAEGNTMRASAYEQNGRLVLSKQRGLTVIFR